MQDSPTLTSEGQVPTLELGDKAAADGAWVKAIQVWISLLDTPADRAGAQQRLQWFLTESAAHPKIAPSFLNPRRGLGALLLAAMACGLFGTALVLIGENMTGTTRNILSTGAWLLYIATAVLVIAYAFRVGKPVTPPIVDLSDADLRHALEMAWRIQATHPASAPPN